MDKSAAIREHTRSRRRFIVSVSCRVTTNGIETMSIDVARVRL